MLLKEDLDIAKHFDDKLINQTVDELILLFAAGSLKVRQAMTI